MAETIGGPVYDTQAPGFGGYASGSNWENEAYGAAFGDAAPYVQAGSGLLGALRGNTQGLKRSVDDLAQAGKRAFGDLADGASMSTDDALEAATEFLGEGYEELKPGSGIFVSADGTRRVRMTDSDLSGHGGKTDPHLNFETGRTTTDRKGRQVFERDSDGNKHVYLEDEELNR